MVGALLDVTPLIGMSLPLEIIGIVVFIRRLRVPMRSVNWTRGGWERGSVATATFLVADIALLSLDHMMFIGIAIMSARLFEPAPRTLDV